MKKKIFISAFVLSLAVCFSLELNAQLTTPAPSPLVTVSQQLGLGEVTLKYSRPGMKGRKVFGNLVPFDKLWRTGANSRTQIHFSEDMMVEGKEVKAGKYALLSIPGQDSWTVILSDNLNGSPAALDDDEKTIKFEVTPTDLSPTVETFTLDINDIRDGSATLWMAWENTAVPVKMTLNTEEQVMASIEKTLAGPSKDDYYAAGAYLYSSGKDMDKALEYVEKGMDDSRFWQVTMRARILAKLGKKEEAMTASKKALELAEKAGNGDYVKINKDLMATLQ